MAVSFGIQVLIQIPCFSLPLLFVGEPSLKLCLPSHMSTQAHSGECLSIDFFLLCFPEKLL